MILQSLKGAHKLIIVLLLTVPHMMARVIYRYSGEKQMNRNIDQMML